MCLWKRGMGTGAVTGEAKGMILRGEVEGEGG